MDERKLARTDSNVPANQLHRGDTHGDAGRLHEPAHPTEEVEDDITKRRAESGTWGEADVGGLLELVAAVALA